MVWETVGNDPLLGQSVGRAGSGLIIRPTVMCAGAVGMLTLKFSQQYDNVVALTIGYLLEGFAYQSRLSWLKVFLAHQDKVRVGQAPDPKRLQRLFGELVSAVESVSFISLMPSAGLFSAHLRLTSRVRIVLVCLYCDT